MANPHQLKLCLDGDRPVPSMPQMASPFARWPVIFFLGSASHSLSGGNTYGLHGVTAFVELNRHNSDELRIS